MVQWIKREPEETRRTALTRDEVETLVAFINANETFTTKQLSEAINVRYKFQPLKYQAVLNLLFTLRRKKVIIQLRSSKYLRCAVTLNETDFEN